MSSLRSPRPRRFGAVATLVSVFIFGPGVGQAQTSASPAALTVKVPLLNDATCKVKATFFGEGLGSKGKKANLRPGKGKNLRLKGPGTLYTWIATASCCTQGEGEFEAPLNKKKNATVAFACTPPLSTPFGLTSKAFDDGGTLPTDYTCDGTNSSPPLAIQNVPVGTQSFALVLDDPDAPGGFLHWVLYDIPVGQAVLPAGFQPDDYGVSGLNDAAQTGYFGACAPRGDNPHRYIFTVYALDVATLNLPEGSLLDAVEAAMEDHILAEDNIIATFVRS